MSKLQNFHCHRNVTTPFPSDSVGYDLESHCAIAFYGELVTYQQSILMFYNVQITCLSSKCKKWNWLVSHNMA